MKSILEYLENSAERFPGKCAFADENSSCSFLELKEAGQKAGSVLVQKRCLRKPVVLLMEKSVRTIQIMMGVVYAGGFYVILDAAQPADRLNRILDTLDAKILVTASEHEEYAHKLRFSGEILREEDLGKGEIDNKALEEISGMCRVAVVKVGKDGSWVRGGKEQYYIPAWPAKPVDGTGAGDTYAAGFLYAHSLGLPIKTCGEVGSIIAARVVEVVGTKIDVPRWREAKLEIRELIEKTNG